MRQCVHARGGLPPDEEVRRYRTSLRLGVVNEHTRKELSDRFKETQAFVNRVGERGEGSGII